jgi:NitT/TauT family transport system substrate-binding protein
MSLSRRRFISRTLAASAASSIAVPRIALAQADPTLRIGIIPSDPFGEAIYTQAGGFFKSAGINVELVPLQNSAAIAAALTGGAINIGLANPIVIASARQHGLSHYAFAPEALFDASAPTTLLMVANNSPLHTAKELEGRTIGSVELAGITQAALRAWMGKNGADAALTKFTEIPFTAMAAALTQGRIDAGFIAEPALAGARATTREIGDPYGAIAPMWCLAMWFSTKEWLTQNTALAHRYAEALQKGAAWANTHHVETGAALKQWTPLTDETISKMTRIRFATSYTPAYLQPVLDTGFKAGILKSPMSASDLMFPGF